MLLLYFSESSYYAKDSLCLSECPKTAVVHLGTVSVIFLQSVMFNKGACCNINVALDGSLLPSPEAMQINSYIMDKFPHQNIGIKGYLSIGSNYTFGDKSAVVLSGDVSINMPVLSTD